MKKLFTLFTLLFALNAFAQQGTDLFFSEYVEGDSQNKALEIYNPTADTIDLDGYSILKFGNGFATPTETLPIQLVNGPNVIKPNGTIVITNGQVTEDDFGVVDPELFALGDMSCSGVYPTVMYFNGNDAIALVKDNNSTLVDLIGKIGEDPGTGWCDQDTLNYQAGDYYWLSWTSNHTMVRKSNVTQGVTSNPYYFNPAEQWELKPLNDWSNLGQHAFGNSPMVKFMVLDNVGPISNAQIVIDNQMLVTDSLGTDSIYLNSGEYIYKIQKAGFELYTDTLIVDSVNIIDTVHMLPSAPYQLAFQLTDHWGDFVKNAIINLGGEIIISDSVGNATIMLDSGMWEYNIQAENLITITDEVLITSDSVLLQVQMEPNLYNFTLKILSYDEPLSQAVVNINNQTLYTDNIGEISIDLGYGEYPFSITKEGYETVLDTVIINTNPVYNEIELQKYFTVTFTVLIDGSPMPNAEIAIDSLVEVTDSTGKAYFDLFNGTYNYIMTLEGFSAFDDSFIVNDENTSILINGYSGIDNDRVVGSIKIYPNPTNGSFEVKSNAGSLIEVMNGLGQIVRKEYSKGIITFEINTEGIYFVRITHNGKTITKKLIIE